MNNNKKNFTRTMISVALSLALTACGSDSNDPTDIIEDIKNTIPAISSTGVLSVEAGSEYSYTLASSDSDGDALTLSATTLPSWLSFDDSTGILSGTPEETDVGDHPVTLTVSDGTDDLTQSFTIAVTAAPEVLPELHAPEITSTALTSVTAGTAYTYTLTATDADSDTLTMSAAIPAEATWLTFDTVTGILSGTPTASDVGTIGVTLTVADGTDADDATQTFSIVVDAVVVPQNNAAVITSTEITNATVDSAYSYTLTATDADTDTLTMSAVIPAELSWLSFNTETGVLSGTPVLANIGAAEITLAVNDGTVDTTQTFTITVADAVVAPVGETPRDASEASFIISDGHNDWESWIETNGSSQIIVDDNLAYGNVNEVTISASQFVAGYRPVDAVGAPIDISAFEDTGTFEFDLKVTTIPSGTDEWFIKIEGAGGTLNDYNIFADNGEHSAIEVGVWKHYSFSLRDLAGLDLTAINNVMLFPSWGSNAGAVYQWDNVAFYPDGAPEQVAIIDGDSGDDATTTVALGVDFEGPQLTWSSFDTDKVQYVANPETAGINTSATSALFEINQGNGEWVGALTQGIDNFALDASNCTVKLDVYKDTISDVHVKFQKNNGVNDDGIMWGSHGTKSATNTLVNQWETLTFDFCDMIGLPENDDIGALALFPDKTTGRSQDTVNYIDNIMFSAQEVAPVVGPVTGAPVPTPLDGDVISVFSDTYTAIASVDTNPNWGQATVTTVIDVAGNDTLKMAGLNYQGIGYANTDVSSKTHLHLDYWTADATGFDVYLIGAGGETLFTVTPTLNGWQSVDIPLTTYSGVVNLSDVFQFKFDAQNHTGGTIYLDNLYFH